MVQVEITVIDVRLYLHFLHVGETVHVLSNCRRKTDIDELRRWNAYRCHPLQNSQNNLLPFFVSFFRGTLPAKWSHITTIERKHIVWTFVSRRCLTGRKRLGSIPASFPRSAEGQSRGGRLQARGSGLHTSMLCSKIWALCFRASSSTRQQHYAYNHARKVALCLTDRNTSITNLQEINDK